MEASEFYKKATEASKEENKLCNACSVSMLLFADMLDCMKAIIEKRTFLELEDKVHEWEIKLTYLKELYVGNKKGELFVDSLYKAIDCLQGLKIYKEDTRFLDNKNVKDCIIELIEVTNNIEGPIQKIFQVSAQQMDTHRQQIILWSGSENSTLREPEPSALKNIQIKIVNMLKLIIKPINSLIVIILGVVIGIILAPYSKNIQNIFSTFISLLLKYFN